MSTWFSVLAASIGVLLLKAVGYLVPRRALERPAAARTAGLLTVALLAALVVTQTVQDGQGVAVDARLPALGVAALLLALRVPFVVVVLAAAVTAALVRWAGWLP
jgi:hypothetical protein